MPNHTKLGVSGCWLISNAYFSCLRRAGKRLFILPSGMLEARVGIEPTHKRFADLHSLCLNPFRSIKPLPQTSILSGFCPASLLKLGTDHDCSAPVAPSIRKRARFNRYRPREKGVVGRHGALPLPFKVRGSTPQRKTAAGKPASQPGLYLTCSAPNQLMSRRIVQGSAPLGKPAVFWPEPYIS
jgi:hypothetical protein